eukprot:TRINITY_DN15129_c0_g2_i4.p1 TRINITY_DN15129_c0_g2~~TRINITY_DN15129_c0_g2_i4.p1  ORF type:complete len:362 (+),score=76.69 TRINITY_DN15129_c0_g2_i4:76-1161(+)
MVDPTKRFHGLPSIDEELVKNWDESLSDLNHRAELAKLLAKVPLFSTATDIFRNSLADALVPYQVSAGATVFRQSLEGDWLAIVLSGRLDCKIKRADQGDAVKVKEVAPGGVVGDMGLLGVAPVRTVTAEATQESTLALLTRAAFEELVGESGGPDAFPTLQAARAMQGLTADISGFCDLACFKRLERKFVAALCEQLEPRLLYAGHAMMKEGDIGHEMFILHAGSVSVEKGGQRLASLGGGVVLGELAVLGSDKRRTATVTCTALCLVYCLHGEVVHNILQRFPESKKIYDHEYVERLLRFELGKVRDEITQLNDFYGKAHPMPIAEVRRKCFGEIPDEEYDMLAISPAASPVLINKVDT